MLRACWVSLRAGMGTKLTARIDHDTPNQAERNRQVEDLSTVLPGTILRGRHHGSTLHTPQHPRRRA